MGRAMESEHSISHTNNMRSIPLQFLTNMQKLERNCASAPSYSVTNLLDILVLVDIYIILQRRLEFWQQSKPLKHRLSMGLFVIRFLNSEYRRSGFYAEFLSKYFSKFSAILMDIFPRKYSKYP